jgi:hypothetical protein
MTGPEVEPNYAHDPERLCADCKHDTRWHCQEGCMIPMCQCRKDITAKKEDA